MANFREVARSQQHPRPRDPEGAQGRDQPVLLGRRPGSTPGLADLDPAFKDLGSKVNHTPTTDIGQAVRRLNLALADLELLTSKLRNPQGRLNTDGSLQKLLIQSDLHDNLNRMAVSANQAFVQLRTVLATLRTFAEKVASDPASMTAGRSRRGRRPAPDGDPIARSRPRCAARHCRLDSGRPSRSDKRLVEHPRQRMHLPTHPREGLPMRPPNRRHFLQDTAALAAGFAAIPGSRPGPTSPATQGRRRQAGRPE